MITFDFHQKFIVITGASRGIGRAIAELLLKLGATVLITSTGRPPEWLRTYINCSHKTLDFLNERSTKSFLTYISGMKQIDILINNAGVQLPGDISVVSEEDWENVFKVNLYGPMLLMRAVSRKMKAAKRGKILNVSSIAGLISRRSASSYSASKSGLNGLTRACAMDMAGYNVLVNAICPGTTETDMVRDLISESQKKGLKAAIPLGRFAEPNEIANMAAFLCSDLNTYITGQTIVVDGGMTIQ